MGPSFSVGEWVVLRRAAVIAASLALAVTLPGVAAAQSDPHGVAQGFGDEQAGRALEMTDRRLTDAIRSLEDIEAAIERAERAVEDAERRLAAASAALAGLEDEVAAAQAALALAEADVAEAATRVERARERMAEADVAEARAVGRLQQRIREVYKHGSGTELQALLTSILGAADWHQVSVSAAALHRIVGEDRELVDATLAARAVAQAARAAAGAERAAAVRAADRATAEQADLERLVDAQRRAVLDVEAERERREAVFAELQADSEVTALLVGTLASQADALRAIPPPPAPEPVLEPDPVQEPDPDPEPAPAPQPEQPDPETEPAPPSAPTPAPTPTPAPSPTPAPAPAPEPPSTPTPGWAGRLPAAGQPWAGEIDLAARRYGVDGRLLAALVWRESSFDPDAVSWAGAAGLTQLMPATARSLGLRIDGTVDERFDPVTNLDAGARYLGQQLDRFGDVTLALAAYNAGPSRVAACWCVPDITETQLYVIRVQEHYVHIAG
jgi:outer membrane biosynthesis protein TonB